jgi:cytochrome c-type biogenesis protein CcmH/NrfG
LESKGRKKDADAIYTRVRGVYSKLVGEYPDCALAHNQLGWLAACCRRDLESGLVSAKRAVELDPKNAAHYDTLTEIYFQLGKKADALQNARAAVRLAPQREYFVKQLARIQAGDPKAPRVNDE